MRITVDLPEDIAQRPGGGREALEAIAVEAYRIGKMSQFDVARLLGLSRIETEDFLAQHVDLYDHSPEELAAEADVVSRIIRDRR